MPLALADSLALVKDPLISGIAGIALNNKDLFKVLPFYRSDNGVGVAYRRMRTLPTTAFVDYGGAVAEDAAEFEDVLTRFRTIMHDTDIPGLEERIGDPVQVSSQMAAGAIAVARHFENALINGGSVQLVLPAGLAGIAAVATNANLQSIGPLGGTGPRTQLSAVAGAGSIRITVAGAVRTVAYRAPGDTQYGAESDDVAAGDPVILLRSGGRSSDWAYFAITSAGAVGVLATTEYPVTSAVIGAAAGFDGLLRLTDPSMLRPPAAAAGEVVSPRMLRELANMVPNVPNTQKVLCMNSREWLNLRDTMDAAGMTSARDLMVPTYGITMPTFDGLPVLLNDRIATNEPIGGAGAVNASRIYCVNLGLPNGQAEDAPTVGTGVFGVYAGSEKQEADGRTCFGMFAGRINTREANDRGQYRVGWDCTLVNYDRSGLACAWGVIP